MTLKLYQATANQSVQSVKLLAKQAIYRGLSGLVKRTAWTNHPEPKREPNLPGAELGMGLVPRADLRFNAVLLWHLRLFCCLPGGTAIHPYFQGHP